MDNHNDWEMSNTKIKYILYNPFLTVHNDEVIYAYLNKLLLYTLSLFAVNNERYIYTFEVLIVNLLLIAGYS